MKIKLLRIELDKTQEELAKELNLPRTKYARFESGESKIPITILKQLADYFDVSLDYLCDRKWNNQIGYIPEDRKDLINEILSLETNEIKEISIFIKGLKAGKQNSNDFKVFH